MATVYVDSTAGGAADGTSWTDAFLTMQAALVDAGTTAGSLVLTSHQHAEVIGSTITWTNNGTIASPIKVISVNKSDDSYLSGASCSSSGNRILTFDGVVLFHGLTIRRDNDFDFNDSCYIEFHDCSIGIFSTASSSEIGAHTDDNRILIKDSSIEFGHADQGFYLGGGGRLDIIGCDLIGTGTNKLITLTNTRGMNVHIESCDFSGMATSGQIIGDWPVSMSDGAGYYFKINNVKLPTSGTVTNTTLAEPSSRVEAFNVATDNTVYKFHIEDYYGECKESTAVYRNATYDGTNGYSMWVTSSGNGEKIYEPFRVKVTDRWCDANPTLTLELIHGSDGDGTGGALQDDEAWIEVMYPDSTTGALGKIVSTRADPQATPSDLTSSSEVWTENITSELEQKISHTVSGGQAGIHTVWFCLATGDSFLDVWLDPEIDVT